MAVICEDMGYCYCTCKKCSYPGDDDKKPHCLRHVNDCHRGCGN